MWDISPLLLRSILKRKYEDVLSENEQKLIAQALLQNSSETLTFHELAERFGKFSDYEESLKNERISLNAAVKAVAVAIHFHFQKKTGTWLTAFANYDKTDKQGVHELHIFSK